jgi:N-methylhydantoinase A
MSLNNSLGVNPEIIAIDAGGTMTDCIIVDSEGNFIDGKALTTPEDESISYMEAVRDTAGLWGLKPETLFPKVVSIVYSGTTALNALLMRRGKRVGLIITKGFEDYPLMERGLVWLGYSYYDRLHTTTHIHNPPLVSRDMVYGVSERINNLGDIIVPLNIDDVRYAAEELCRKKAEAIAIVFLYSYINPAHEERAKEIVMEVLNKYNVEIPVVTSNEVAPIMREYSRLNSTLIQAYASETTRLHMARIEVSSRKYGYKGRVYTMTAYGSLVSIDYPRFYETLVSGPVGGILGARYIGSILNLRNIVTSDMGGTSFDVGIIKEGIIPIVREPDIARFRLNLPAILLDSIPGGTGMVVRVDPITKRILLGPESAGSRVGVSFEFDQLTISDCDLILGYLNPDYFLGGKVMLNKEAATKAVAEVSELLEKDIYETAYGIVEILHSRCRDHIYSVLLGRGYNPLDFTLMVYGGGGPLHMWGFTENIPFKNIITFPFAAVFSAFGIATTDYAHRLHKSILAYFPPGDDEEMRAGSGIVINAAWEELENTAVSIMTKEGFDPDEIRFRRYLYIRYKGQLEDIEVLSPVDRIYDLEEDVNKVINAFEEAYLRIYPSAAKYPEAGYLILEVAVEAYIETPKPRISMYVESSREPPDKAFKGERDAYFNGKWHVTPLYEMGLLEAGNRINGPAIIEHPTTTLVIPPEHGIRFDRYRFIWYR